MDGFPEPKQEENEPSAEYLAELTATLHEAHVEFMMACTDPNTHPAQRIEAAGRLMWIGNEYATMPDVRIILNAGARQLQSDGSTNRISLTSVEVYPVHVEHGLITLIAFTEDGSELVFIEPASFAGAEVVASHETPITSEDHFEVGTVMPAPLPPEMAPALELSHPTLPPQTETIPKLDAFGARLGRVGSVAEGLVLTTEYDKVVGEGAEQFYKRILKVDYKGIPTVATSSERAIGDVLGFVDHLQEQYAPVLDESDDPLYQSAIVVFGQLSRRFNEFWYDPGGRGNNPAVVMKGLGETIQGLARRQLGADYADHPLMRAFREQTWKGI